LPIGAIALRSNMVSPFAIDSGARRLQRALKIRRLEISARSHQGGCNAKIPQLPGT